MTDQDTFMFAFMIFIIGLMVTMLVMNTALMAWRLSQIEKHLQRLKMMGEPNERV